jgi:hypothetical protein
MPAIGPSKAEYPTNHSNMYMSAEDISFQGIINIPKRPVISPPVLKLMYYGAKLAKSLAGLTTLAAILTESVAIAILKSERIAVKILRAVF